MDTLSTDTATAAPITALVRATPIDIEKLEAPEEFKANCRHLAAQMSGNVEGFEDSTGDWRPPKLKVIQPVTQDPPEGSTPGMFFTKTDLVKKPLKGVVAYVWYSRAFYQDDQACQCINVDMKARTVAEDRSINVYGEACAKCPHNAHPRTPFKKAAKGEERKKLCQNMTNVAFVAEDGKNVYHLEFKGTSAPAGRQLVDMAKAAGLPWNKMFAIDTEKKTRDGGGLYYVFKPTPMPGLVPEYLKAVAKAVKDYFADYRERTKTETRVRSDEVREAVQIDSITDEEIKANGKKKGIKDEF